MKFNIGDKVWVAFSGQFSTWITCPHCFGKKFLTVILGDDSRVTIDCAGCQLGYDPPMGSIQEYQFQAKVQEFTIERVEIANGAPKYNYYDEENVFATKEEAEARAEGFREAHERDEKNRLERLKENQKRNWAWNATYHRRELKEALRKVEYHTAKLNVAKAHVKEETKTP